MRIFNKFLLRSFPLRSGAVAAGVLALAGLSGLTGCEGGKSGPTANANEVAISGTFSNCFGDSIRLYEYHGGRVINVGAGKLEKGEAGFSFSFTVPVSGPGIYLVGPDPRLNVGLAVEPGQSITLGGDCNNLNGTVTVEGSDLASNYNTFLKSVGGFQGKSNQLMQNLQAAQMTNPGAVGNIQAQLQASNDQYFSYLDSVVNAGGFLAHVAKLYSFKPYMSDASHQSYQGEEDYFLKGFFNGIDLKDPAYNYIPQLTDKAKFFAFNVSSRPLDKETKQSAIDGYLNQIPEGSIARRLFIQGVLDGLDQSKSDLYVDYGQRFTQNWASDPMAAAVSQKIAAMQRFAAGVEAPEIEGENPSGKNVKLSDLRGKVVLIDFWASWCRPCRMENPNVKKAYAKYAPKGFEILGVSLDQQKQKWVDAIAQDGLPWKHVSDLRGWQSQHAALYNVSSIPATFLLDKEGKILAKNLRGPALEAKLEEIFGS